MRLAEAANESFARHETFHPRWGWFTKAVQGADSDPSLFSANDATLRLGVGKNMVKAIRFWGLASRVLTLAENPANSRNSHVVVSRMGHALMGEAGLDPYLENPETLWLLHWLMLTPRTLLPVWWLTFCEFKPVEFDESGLSDFVIGRVEATPEWARREESSIVKDVSCLLRMYAPGSRSRVRDGIDDLLDCPFRELGLIRPSSIKPAGYRFGLGSKPNLTPCILGFAAFDYLARTDPRARAATVSRLVTEKGAPGQVFKLTENNVTELLSKACDVQEGDVAITTSAGVTQVNFADPPDLVATRFLLRNYGLCHDGPVLAGFGTDLPAESRFRPLSPKGGNSPLKLNAPPVT